MKIRLVGAKLRDRQSDRWTERQIDMTKLIFVFRNFDNVHKIVGQKYKVG